MPSLRTTIACCLAVATGVAAQPPVTVTVGPQVAPVFGPILITVSNETGATMCAPCWDFMVTNAAGVVVRPITSNACTGVCIPFPDGAVMVDAWYPSTNPIAVGPGPYTVSVDTEIANPTNPLIHHTVTIGGIESAVAQYGPLRIGQTRSLALIAPTRPFRLYVMAAALGTSPGIPLCAGTLPLNPDPLFGLSLDPASGVFHGFRGVLDARGESVAAVTLPGDPGLVGGVLHFAFVTLEPGAACPFGEISPALSARIQ